MIRFRPAADWRGAAALAAVAAAALFYLVAAGPLDRAVREREARAARLAKDLAWMRDAAGRLKHGSRPAAVKGSLPAFADRTLQQAGLAPAVERIAAGSAGSVRVWFGEVEFARLVAWMARARESGVRITGCRLDGRGNGRVRGEVRLAVR